LKPSAYPAGHSGVGALPEHCGAFHAASHVAEFGVHGAGPLEISSPSGTKWQHGLIPSSHAAIEAQSGLTAGSVSIAATRQRCYWAAMRPEQTITW